MSNVYGWRVEVLVSDCGSRRLSQEVITNFLKKLLSIMKERRVLVNKVRKLSDFFNPRLDESQNVFDKFIEISSAISKKQLEDLKNKNYSEEVQRENDLLPVLDYILPVLQISVVCCIENKLREELGMDSKNLVLAGNDELNQWRHVCKEYANQHLGVLLIPKLCDEENSDIWQPGITQYLSEAELKQDITRGNLGFWCYSLFVKLQEMNKLERLSTFNLEDEVVLEWKSKQFSNFQKIDFALLSKEIWKTIKLAT